MWYVNTEKEIEEIRRLHKFYINYVICKFLISFKLVPFKLCFILTMWYVNTYLSWSKTANLTSFILTMWYVNAVKKNEDKLDKECFILTMWYVNHTKKLLLEYANKVLY